MNNLKKIARITDSKKIIRTDKIINEIKISGSIKITCGYTFRRKKAENIKLEDFINVEAFEIIQKKLSSDYSISHSLNHDKNEKLENESLISIINNYNKLLDKKFLTAKDLEKIKYTFKRIISSLNGHFPNSIKGTDFNKESIDINNIKKIINKEIENFQSRFIGKIYSTALYKDDNLIILGCLDSTIKIIDRSNNYRVIYTLRGHSSCITSLKFYGNYKYLLSTSFDCYIKMWNFKDRKVVKEIPIGNLPISCSDIYNNSYIIATLSGDVKKYELPKFREYINITVGKPIQFIRFITEKKFIFWSDQRYYYLYNGIYEHARGTIKSAVTGICFPENKNFIICKSKDTLEQIIFESNNRNYHLKNFNPDTLPSVLAISNDSTKVLYKHQGKINSLYDERSLYENIEFLIPLNNSKDTLLGIDDKLTFSIIDFSNSVLEKNSINSCNVYSQIIRNHENIYLLTNNCIYKYNSITKQEICKEREENLDLMTLQLNRDLLFVLSSFRVLKFKKEDLTFVGVIEFDHRVTSIVCSSKPSLLFILTCNKEIIGIHPYNGNILLRPKENNEKTFMITISPDDRHLASVDACNDNKYYIRIWKIKGGILVSKVCLESYSIIWFKFSKDNKTITTINELMEVYEIHNIYTKGIEYSKSSYVKSKETKDFIYSRSSFFRFN